MDHVQEVLRRLKKVRSSASSSRETSWEACCPAHDDSTPSLSITLGQEGQVLLYCHAGCDTADIVKALGLEWTDLFPEHLRKNSAGKGHSDPEGTEAEYRYRDEEGKVLFRVIRLGQTSAGKKRFILQRPDGQGGWENGIRGIRRVLYRLPEVKKAVAAGVPILYVEGEKDVEMALKLAEASPVRFEPTTSPMGAGKWLKTYGQDLAGAVVWIIPDQDEAGHAHARHVATSLEGMARSVQIVELPSLEEHGDLTDWIRLGHSVEDLIRIIRQGASIGDSRITGGTRVETDLSWEKELFSGNGSHSSGAIGRRGMFSGTTSHPPADHTTTEAVDAPKVDQALHEQKLHVEVNRGQALGSDVPDTIRQSQPRRRQTGRRMRPSRRTSRRQAEVLRGLLADLGTTAFRDRRSILYVEVPRAEAGESSGMRTYRLDDHDFALYLARLFFRETGQTASRQAIAAVTWLLESEARYGAEVRPVFTRVAFLDGTVYLDLGSDYQPVVEVSSSGWALTAAVPATFLRPAGMAPLPNPVRGGSLELLRECLHLAPGESWTIIRAWVLASLLPFGDVPPLFIGDAGALRTSALALRLAYLLDPWCMLPRQASARARRLASDRDRFVQLIDLAGRLVEHLTLFKAVGQGFGGEADGRLIVTDQSDVSVPENVRYRCLRVMPVWNVSEVAGAPVRGRPGSFFESVHGSIVGAILDAAVEAFRGYSSVDVPQAYRGTALEPLVRWVSAAEKAIGGPAPRLVEVLTSGERGPWWRRSLLRRLFPFGR